MKSDILKNLNNPKELEILYRKDKSEFKRTFNLLYPEIQNESSYIQFWNIRLNTTNELISWGTRKELLFVIVLSFIAGLIAKISDFSSINPEYFYPRNIGFIIFPALTAYFAFKQSLPTKKLLTLGCVFAAAILYINLLPDNPQSDTLILACIHLPLFLWSVLGFAFVGSTDSPLSKRLEFLRYNGDLLVMTAIILISGGLMTAFTIGLFELIEINIEDIYMKYVGIFGLSATPIVATFLVRTNSHLVSKVSPVVAKIFTPLVFVMLVVYVSAVFVTGKDPYNDREFLVLFNLLLVAVMALILFSIVETTTNGVNNYAKYLLFGLSLVTIIVNGIALSAIIFRISEWGITPNRLAVLGGNLLILANLIVVSIHLFVSFRNQQSFGLVETSTSKFLPIYALWTILVTFIFPMVFNFK